MAQLDPFTPIHNNVLEAIMAAGLSAAELCVILAVWRKTYGFKDGQVERRKFAYLGVQQIMSMTNLSETSTHRALKSLKEKGMINRSQAKTGFCKDFMAKTPKSGTAILGTPNSGTQGAKSGGKGAKSGTNKRNKKETTKETISVIASQPHDNSVKQEGAKMPPESHSKKQPIVKHSADEYKSIISYTANVQGLKLLGNYGKQMRFGKLLFDAGYTVADIHYAAINMWKDTYWRTHPFDLSNIYNNIHRYQERGPIALTAEQESLLKWENPEQRVAIEKSKKQMKELVL